MQQVPIQVQEKSDSHFSKTYRTTADINAGLVSQERFISEGDEWANGPFDFVSVDSSDSVELEIQLDYSPDNILVIPAQSSKIFKGLKFRNFSIKNKDAAAAHTAGKVAVQVMNTKQQRRA